MEDGPLSRSPSPAARKPAGPPAATRGLPAQLGSRLVLPPAPSPSPSPPRRTTTLPGTNKAPTPTPSTSSQSTSSSPSSSHSSSESDSSDDDEDGNSYTTQSTNTTTSSSSSLSSSPAPSPQPSPPRSRAPYISPSMVRHAHSSAGPAFARNRGPARKPARPAAAAAAAPLGNAWQPPRLPSHVPTGSALHRLLPPAMLPVMASVRVHYGLKPQLDGPYQRELSALKTLSFSPISTIRVAIGWNSPVTKDTWRGVSGQIQRFLAFCTQFGATTWPEASLKLYITHTNLFFAYLGFLLVSDRAEARTCAGQHAAHAWHGTAAAKAVHAAVQLSTAPCASVSHLMHLMHCLHTPCSSHPLILLLHACHC
jgi:hypothetical protein